MTKGLREKRLIRNIIVKQDPDAYALIYDSYHKRIYRFVFFKVGSREEAEDITSDVFLKVWDYLTGRQSVDVESLSGLIYTVARRCIIDHYRQRGRDQGQSLESLPELVSHGEQGHDYDIVAEHAVLISSIKTLKQEYQDVIILRYIEEYSTKEIADILGKKRANVRVLLHRATKKLKDMHDT
jgi:RNA polymerase sigma-70 factor, ECF subfamily